MRQKEPKSRMFSFLFDGAADWSAPPLSPDATAVAPAMFRVPQYIPPPVGMAYRVEKKHRTPLGVRRDDSRFAQQSP